MEFHFDRPVMQPAWYTPAAEHPSKFRFERRALRRKRIRALDALYPSGRKLSPFLRPRLLHRLGRLNRLNGRPAICVGLPANFRGRAEGHPLSRGAPCGCD